jgi:hypothetical protein
MVVVFVPDSRRRGLVDALETAIRSTQNIHSERTDSYNSFGRRGNGPKAAVHLYYDAKASISHRATKLARVDATTALRNE